MQKYVEKGAIKLKSLDAEDVHKSNRITRNNYMTATTIFGKNSLTFHDIFCEMLLIFPDSP